VPDDNDERAPASAKPLDTLRHELTTDALTLVCRSDRHRPERRPYLSPHRQRAEHDVAHDGAIRNGNEGQGDGPGVAKSIDDATFLLLIEGLPIQLPDGIDIRRLFFSDLNQVVPGCPTNARLQQRRLTRGGRLHSVSNELHVSAVADRCSRCSTAPRDLRHTRAMSAAIAGMKTRAIE
jgi:hypothetical protein